MWKVNGFNKDAFPTPCGEGTMRLLHGLLIYLQAPRSHDTTASNTADYTQSHAATNPELETQARPVFLGVLWIIQSMTMSSNPWAVHFTLYSLACSCGGHLTIWPFLEGSSPDKARHALAMKEAAPN